MHIQLQMSLYILFMTKGKKKKKKKEEGAEKVL